MASASRLDIGDEVVRRICDAVHAAQLFHQAQRIALAVGRRSKGIAGA